MLHVNYTTKRFFDIKHQKFFTKILKRWGYTTKINYWIHRSSAGGITIRKFGNPIKYRYLDTNLKRKHELYYYLGDGKMIDINEYHKEGKGLFCKRVNKNQKTRLQDVEEVVLALRHKGDKKGFFTYEEKEFKFIKGQKYHRRGYNDNEHLTKIVLIDGNKIGYSNFFGDFVTSKARFKTMFYIK